jgi:hypothetical protein
VRYVKEPAQNALVMARQIETAERFDEHLGRQVLRILLVRNPMTDKAVDVGAVALIDCGDVANVACALLWCHSRNRRRCSRLGTLLFAHLHSHHASISHRTDL